MHFNVRLLLGSSLIASVVIGLSACSAQMPFDADPDWIDLENYEPTHETVTAYWWDFHEFGTYYHENKPLLYYKKHKESEGIAENFSENQQPTFNNTIRASLWKRDYDSLSEAESLVDEADSHLNQLGLSRLVSLDISTSSLPMASKTQIPKSSKDDYVRSSNRHPYDPVSILIVNPGSDEFRQSLTSSEFYQEDNQFQLFVRLDVGQLVPTWSTESDQQILPLGRNNTYALQRCNMHDFHVVHSIGFSGVLVDHEGYVVRAGFEGFYIDDRILRYNKKDDFCSAPGDSIDIFGTLTGMDVDERTYFLIDQQKFNEQLARGELDDAWKAALETLVTTLINGYDEQS